ncbi:hypothetical protein O181_079220 [Austropuccinia psidii MF-1]|uniref:Integrase catalytic domain-containing protein n=1 Tax=Austropuccinia psidii MF-1 TaxID=1389203 RepID=A0A9Q3FED9_9BASI|nr:hypothetical protein [Austropuccinia psidii MF-1]
MFPSIDFSQLWCDQLLTAPYTPQQNPFAERANRTLFERVRCLLSDSWLDHSWWGEAAATAAYLLNRTPVSSQDFKTPYERFYNKKSELRSIHPFGSKIFINKEKKKLTSKLSSRAENGIFVGYTKGHKNFKVYNLETGKFQITHDCLFLDTPAGPLGRLVNGSFCSLSSCDVSLNPLPQFHLSSLDFNPSLSESLHVDSTMHELLGDSEQAGALQVGDSGSEGYCRDRSVCYDSSLLADPEPEECVDDFQDEVVTVEKPVAADCV